MVKIKNDKDLYDLPGGECGEYVSEKTGLVYHFFKDDAYQNLEMLRADFDLPEEEMMDKDFDNMVTYRVYERDSDIGYVSLSEKRMISRDTEIGYRQDDLHVNDFSLTHIDRLPIWDMHLGYKEMSEIIPEAYLAAKDIEDCIQKCLADHSVTAWHVIEKKDGGTYAVVVGFSDGFEGEDMYGRDGERLCVKWAFLPDNSAMTEYGMDWIMPEIPGDKDHEIYDSETSLCEGDDIYKVVEWIYKDYYSYMDLKELAEKNTENLDSHRLSES